MNSTMTYEQATPYEQTRHRRPVDIYPKKVGRRGVGQAILEWLGRVGERSGMACRAELFARLNALSDQELAAIGLHRQELLVRCFGGRVLI